MKKSFWRTVLAVVVGLLSIANAFGDVGDTGDVADECESIHLNLRSLCQVTTAQFDSPSGEYVHLGGDVYVVIVSGLAHVVNGIYVANIESKRVNQFAGYAESELIGVTKGTDGSVWIRVRRSDMTHSKTYEGETLLERRVNPITRVPFLIGHSIWAEQGDEDVESFCSKSKNRKKTEGVGLGKTVYLSEKNIERLQLKSVSMDRGQVKRILDAYKKALRIDKNMKFEAYALLEKAGIQRILDVKPANMTIGQYVNILNDYAFWAYQYGEGRNDLAIEILYKVIRLSPDRAAAYLNMADALENLASFGATEYASTPLDDKSIDILKKSAEIYRGKYNGMIQKHGK